MRLAMEMQTGEIAPSILERVFVNEVWWEGVGELNPFSTNFIFRRLDRGNEPFERGNFANRKRR
jgi:hypothetical protein